MSRETRKIVSTWRVRTTPLVISLCSLRIAATIFRADTPPRDEVQLQGENEDTVLHVSNLTRNVSEAHLREIFSTYGNVASVELGKRAHKPGVGEYVASCDSSLVAAVDEKVGLPRGWARVEFAAGRDAEVAQHLMDGVSEPRFVTLQRYTSHGCVCPL